MSQHERSDADIRSLVGFGAGILVLIVVALIAMGTLFRYLAAQPKTGPGPSPMAGARELPPAPRLQVTPGAELERVRAAEDAVLGGYAWVDRKAGIVRIPIDRAMDLVAERTK